MALSKRAAEALWNKLDNYLELTQETLQEIIDNKAWEPLGYDTFTEAWKARKGDNVVASFIAPTMIYQMLAEGASVDEIADTVTGISRKTAEDVDRQRRAGVPANRARLGRKAGQRKDESAALKTFSVKLPVETYDALDAVATQYDSTVEDCVLEAIQDYLERYGE